MKPRSFVFYKDIVYQVLDWDSEDLSMVDLVVYETGENVQISMGALFYHDPDETPTIFADSMEEMASRLTEENLKNTRVVTANGISEEHLNEARRMISIVKKVEAGWTFRKEHPLPGGGVPKKEDYINEIGKTFSPSFKKTRYYEIRTTVNEFRWDENEIAASLKRRDSEHPRFSNAQFHLIDTFAMLYYVRRENSKKILTIHQMILEILERTNGYWVDPDKLDGADPENLISMLLVGKIPISAILQNSDYRGMVSKIEPPSKTSFYEYMDWFTKNSGEGKAAMIIRLGRDVWEKHFLVFDHFINLASFPLEFVFADHWEIHIYLVSDHDRKTLYKVHLTALIDAFSRCIVGFSINDHRPRIESIQSALEHGIFYKTSHLELGLETPYVCFGIPCFLFLDNDWSHHSHSLENLIRKISKGGEYREMVLVFRPPYKGRYGAIIERVFVNFSSRVREFLPGAIQGESRESVAKAKQSACLIMDDIVLKMHELILEYHHTAHSSLEMTPHQKWMEGVKLISIPDIPPYDEAMKHAFLRGNHKRLRIGKEGIRIFGMRYKGPGANQLRYEKTPFTSKQKGSKRQHVLYDINYDKNDISKIYLFKDGIFVAEFGARERKLPDGSYNPLSYAARELAKKMAREVGLPSSTWLDFADRAEKLTQQRKKEQRQAESLSGLSTPKLDLAYVDQLQVSSLDTHTEDAEEALAGFYVQEETTSN